MVATGDRFLLIWPVGFYNLFIRFIGLFKLQKFDESKVG